MLSLWSSVIKVKAYEFVRCFHGEADANVCPLGWGEMCHCAAGGVFAVVLEAATAEEDPEKGPSNDSLESSDFS